MADVVIACEKSNKRRNILRWKEARLRRLDWGVKKGFATPQQIARATQLANQIQILLVRRAGDERRKKTGDISWR